MELRMRTQNSGIRFLHSGGLPLAIQFELDHRSETKFGNHELKFLFGLYGYQIALLV